MPVIRPYQESDRQQVEEICIKTAPDALVATERKREEVLFLYNRYYTRVEQEHCFVLENDAGHPVGYVLCAPDYKRYKKGFLSHEVKNMCKLGPAAIMLAYGEVSSIKTFAKKYPAHLHIDILPEYQHQGWGSRLLDTLLAHLVQIGVPGVVLVAGAQNHMAILFYEKYGMERLGNIGGGVAFGKTLQMEG